MDTLILWGFSTYIAFIGLLIGFEVFEVAVWIYTQLKGE